MANIRPYKKEIAVDLQLDSEEMVLCALVRHAIKDAQEGNERVREVVRRLHGWGTACGYSCDNEHNVDTGAMMN